ncbi:MAG: hydantoinase B/oxoprolinase family protein [Gammaproteobacteria bacterium]|nr:hydantoinase B/oxoprolinase family protein [Gammaproteobacteria bacterium]
MSGGRWQFWIDRGGTFTDVIARRPDGALLCSKLLSEAPGLYEDAAVESIRRMLDLPVGAPITAERVECVRMGTTVATNALLERRGERTVLVTTQGFGDALRIGNQARPELFARRIRLPDLLYERVIEARERTAARGEVVTPLDLAALAADLAGAYQAGLRSCAIVFMHAYRNPAHERAAQELAIAAGFTQVSVSHRVSGLVRFVPRGDTTLVDAYLTPILARYVDRLARLMPGVRLLFMQSSGGLAEAHAFRGKDAILSGPAGGILGMVRTGRAAGHERLIGFDMGGTSTDVSHYAGELERSYDTQIAGVRVTAPMMSIHTIAAGGGSIIRFDGTRLRVGPESAGADPGPACYRRGGPLTITDANLLLGRIRAEFFPRVFGDDGRQGPDRGIVEQGFADLARRMAGSEAASLDAERAAAGALQIAVGAMANAVKRISVARGYDVSRYALQCFGGAGGQHACLVADALGISRVLCHPLAGVMSAYGMGLAELAASREAALDRRLDTEGLAAARLLAADLAAEASADLWRQGAEDAPRIAVRLLIRYEGTDTTLACEPPEPPDADEAVAAAALREAFERAYRQRFSFLMPERALVIEAVTVEARSGEPAAGPRGGNPPLPHAPEPALRLPLYCFADGQAQGWREAAWYLESALTPGSRIEGPAAIAGAHATTVIEPGWRARVDAQGCIEIERVGAAAARAGVSTAADPVLLEVFNNLFMNVAEQMGSRLQNAAHSVNIKERLDFSCALFDARGSLIANAPHMPVHLGSMSESIRAVIARHPRMRPGEAFALNDPYHGGTHLPDVTVVTPVFLDEDRPSFFVASRGHHADVGGISPGSMPPFSRRIDEEGVLIDDFTLVEDGIFRERAMRERLVAGPSPARNPEQNLADLRAQLAANEQGAVQLRALVATHGRDVVAAYMQHVQDNAAESVRRVITALRDGEFELPLDNGARIRVAVRVDAAARTACVDFAGTSGQLADNFNAPRAITVAAVLYVFRTLVDDAIPLNGGCLEPLEIRVPAGSMLDPRSPAAVVAGNVETSSCVTNALYGALGVLAASQCTMNNFTFGDATHQYYETIAGGSGAGPGFDGTDVVQTHMTNSRLTDPEILELRFPVRLQSFAIRRGSGGAGRWRGGDGAVRRIEFLAPMRAAILSNGRQRGAFGLAGGAPGAPGVNRVERADGRIEPLDYIGEVQVRAGDVFVIETPGGGGYGTPSGSAGQPAGEGGQGRA